MNELQQKEFEILQQVDLCCKELGIKYFLDGGTMIGAVRHRGFIPWDDDIDIAMNRKNYDKFIREAPAWLEKHGLFLQDFSTEKTTPFSYVKVRLNGTKFVEYCNRNVKMHDGIYIDIFPFDYLVSKNQFIKIRLWEKLFAYHQTPDITQKPNSVCLWAKFIARRILHYAVQLVPIDFIYRKLKKALTINKTGEYCGHLYTRNSKILASDTDDNVVYLDFEDGKFPVPQSYDDYLTRIYGDYMTFPPESERVGHRPYILSLGE